MATEITSAKPGQHPEVIQAKPLIMVIGHKRYQIETAVQIRLLPPRRAEVIPIDRERGRR